MKSIKAFLLCVIVLMAQASFGQPADEKARELVSLGKKFYFNKQWKDAANSFELATQRPENELSTFAWYMAGVSYFNGDNKEKAEELLSKFLKQYPDSKYAEDAKYHRAWMLLSSARTNDRDRGLDQMLSLMETGSNPKMKKDAENAVRSFIFYQFDLSYLNVYRTFVKDGQKLMFAEAICYQLDKKGEGQRVINEIKSLQESGIKPSPYLTALKAKLESGRVTSSSKVKIAIFASLFGNKADTATVVPSKSQAGVELLEGMMIAIDSLGRSIGKEIVVKVFDSRGDSAYTKTHFDSLAAFNPDIVVSDMRTNVALVLSEWGEKRKVVTIVPKNTLNEIIANKKYTFLAHPSVSTLGKATATYYAKTLGKKTMTVFNDKSYFSEKLSKAFVAAGQANGAVVYEKVISKDPGRVRTEASTEAKNIKSAGTEVVYIPISNEESAGMILSYLNYHSAKPLVAGGPDWEAFSVIDAELKTSFALTYAAVYYSKNDSVGMVDFTYDCFDRFSYEPTSNTVTGYDVMAWLLSFAKDMHKYQDPAMAVHKAERYHGIHHDFYIGEAQDNQEVNLVQFIKGRTDKVNGY